MEQWIHFYTHKKVKIDSETEERNDDDFYRNPIQSLN